MRGKPLHNLLANRTRRPMEASFERVWTEHKRHRNGTITFLDLFGQTGPVQLAIEVETTARHAVDNARKAAAVDVPVWFIVPHSRLQRALQSKFEMLNLSPGGETIKILLLGQLEQALTNYLSRRIDKRINNRKSCEQPIGANSKEADANADQVEKRDRSLADDHPDCAAAEALGYAGDARQKSRQTVPFNRPSGYRYPATRDHLHHNPRDIHHTDQQTLMAARVWRSNPMATQEIGSITHLGASGFTEFCCRIRGP